MVKLCHHQRRNEQKNYVNNWDECPLEKSLNLDLPYFPEQRLKPGFCCDYPAWIQG
jgi:hypothetical protein